MLKKLEAALIWQKQQLREKEIAQKNADEDADTSSDSDTDGDSSQQQQHDTTAEVAAATISVEIGQPNVGHQTITIYLKTSDSA